MPVLQWRQRGKSRVEYETRIRAGCSVGVPTCQLSNRHCRVCESRVLPLSPLPYRYTMPISRSPKQGNYLPVSATPQLAGCGRASRLTPRLKRGLLQDQKPAQPLLRT